MTGSGVDGRVVRLERRISPRDDIARMSDDELRAALWRMLPANVAELRDAADAGDARAIKALAAVREALA